MLRIALIVLLSIAPPAAAFAQDQPAEGGGAMDRWLREGWLSYFFAEEPSYWTIGQGVVDRDAETAILDRFTQAKIDFKECRSLCAKSFSFDEVDDGEKRKLAQCNAILPCLAKPRTDWAHVPTDDFMQGCQFDPQHPDRVLKC